MKKLMVCICLSFLVFIGFQTASAQTGTCGTNVIYTISGDTISFSKADSSSTAKWGDDCRTVFKDNNKITVVKMTNRIQGMDSFDEDNNPTAMFYECQYIKKWI